VVRAGAVGEHEGTRDDNAGVGHGRDVPRQPDLPEGMGVWWERNSTLTTSRRQTNRSG
jgi:hypothetical protein